MSSDEEPDDVLPRCRHAMLLLYDLVVDPKKCLDQTSGNSVGAKLGLSASEWTAGIYGANVIGMCTVGVSGDRTVKHSDNLADVLTMAVVLVERGSLECQPGLLLGKGRHELGGVSPSSVSVFAFPDAEATTLTRRYLSAVSGQKIGLGAFMLLCDHSPHWLAQLRRIACKHRDMLFQRSGGRDNRKAKFKRHIDWNNAFGQAVQRNLNEERWKREHPFGTVPMSAGLLRCSGMGPGQRSLQDGAAQVPRSSGACLHMRSHVFQAARENCARAL